MKIAVGFLIITASAIAQAPLTEREKTMLDRIERLEQRLAAVEAATGVGAHAVVAEAVPAKVSGDASLPVPELAPAGTTMSVAIDGYYGYNFNRPANGQNTLRAYDVSSNGFAINQADIILERAPDVARGRRVGVRLDLMFGQATEALQGSRANEARPEVFRNLFQVYGTWVAPVGKGLTLDFGNGASSFGIENNYTKDQINYSRSYWFNFLPYYHAGLRASYPLNGKLGLSYWLVNGLNQTEDFNSSRSQAVLLNFNQGPVSANLNYYEGREQRVVAGREPRGRTHILDSYITWQATRRLALAAEADYAISRVEEWSGPQRVTGGAAYARYRWNPRFSLATRYERLNDSGALFSGTRQNLNDATATATLDVADGFQMRWEYRRDWSDAAYFPTSNPRVLKREQNTALLGLIWWFGGKQGIW